jgi:salicylate hydroxylase
MLKVLDRAWPRERLALDHRCIGVQHDSDGVRLTFARRDGREVVAHVDAVIGADGIHSVLREALVPAIDARFSGLCAFRCLVPAERAPAMTLRPVQSLWLGPGRHFVHYPISAGRLVNIVAIVPAGDWRTESWTADGSVDDLRREFATRDARVLQQIDSPTQTKRWALYDRTPLDRYADGRIALLGDAAHAMLPFFAQGAAQAVEDAFALAACLRDVDRTAVPDALARYDTLRRPRASRVQLMSRGREVRNHLPDGPEQQRRDAELARGDPLRDSAWLYAEHR